MASDPREGSDTTPVPAEEQRSPFWTSMDRHRGVDPEGGTVSSCLEANERGTTARMLH